MGLPALSDPLSAGGREWASAEQISGAARSGCNDIAPLACTVVISKLVRYVGSRSGNLAVRRSSTRHDTRNNLTIGHISTNERGKESSDP
jgi:hypothetical protein